MADSNEDRGKSRRLGVEDREWSSIGRIHDGRMIERSGDAVCDLYRAQGDEKHGFFDLASKPRLTISPSLVSKSVATDLVVWPQNHSLEFSGLGTKTRAVVW
jgi:hypothetical protein